MKNLALLLLLAAARPARAANVEFITFNALHYGWAANVAKPGNIRAALAFRPAARAVLFQEVMSGADLSPISPYPTYMHYTTRLLGHGNYKESYAIMVSTIGFAAMGACYVYPDVPGAFSRPPGGALITTAAGGKDIWLIDYHAVFGNSMTNRKAEIGEIPTAAAWFRGQRRATQLVGGDWNLRGDVAPMSNFGFEVVRPTNTPTSLKQTGGGWSQPYDHFALLEAHISTISYNGAGAAACSRINPPNTATWRSTTSDHVPVTCFFNY